MNASELQKIIQRLQSATVLLQATELELKKIKRDIEVSSKTSRKGLKEVNGQTSGGREGAGEGIARVGKAK